MGKGFRQVFKRSLSELTDLLAPPCELYEGLPKPIAAPFCQQCGKMHDAHGMGEFLCLNCRERTWSFDWARAAYPMKGPVREAILGFKYREQHYHLSRLVDWLEQAYLKYARTLPIDALVCVPLHPLRLRERGFNQAQLLAKALGKRQQLQFWKCLERTKATEQQANLSREERLSNLKTAFKVRPSFNLSGKNLLLIDDVFTTGATVEACARSLCRSGVCRVTVLTIARA